MLKRDCCFRTTVVKAVRLKMRANNMVRISCNYISFSIGCYSPQQHSSKLCLISHNFKTVSSLTVTYELATEAFIYSKGSHQQPVFSPGDSNIRDLRLLFLSYG